LLTLGGHTPDAGIVSKAWDADGQHVGAAISVPHRDRYASVRVWDRIHCLHDVAEVYEEQEAAQAGALGEPQACLDSVRELAVNTYVHVLACKPLLEVLEHVPFNTQLPQRRK
jgi:hypothetical protein